MIRYILLSAFLTTMVFSIVTYTACVKDACANVTCQNGGTCANGTCTCLSGYTGNRCQTQLCAENNTGQVNFINRSANSTYSILWDGAVIATVGAGQSSAYFTESAGVAHTLEFRYANGTTDACSTSSPVLTQCEAESYYCGN